MTFTFKIDIGDWSGDGHGISQSYLVSASKDIAAVREAYFAAREKLPGLCPEDFMCDYEDHRLPREVYEAALAAGYDFLRGYRDDPDFEARLTYPQVGPAEMADYVIWFIGRGDPDLKLEKLPDNPSLAYPGGDARGRHIGFIGYGLMR